MLFDYRPFLNSNPRLDCPPFWPTDKIIPRLRKLNRPCPLRVQHGETYLHTRRRIKDCGRAQDRTTPLDPEDPYIKGSWFKLEPGLARKLKDMDDILVNGYRKLSDEAVDTTASEEQTPRFLRQLFDYFLYTICPENDGDANPIATATVLSEEKVTDQYMREALLHCASKVDFGRWLAALHLQSLQIREDSQPDSVDAFANLTPPLEEIDGDPDYEERIPARRARTALDVPEQAEDDQSKEEVYWLPKAAAETAFAAFDAEYKKARQILTNAMGETDLRRKDGSKKALDAFELYQGFCTEALLRIESFIERAKASKNPNLPQLDRITSALMDLQRVEVGEDDGNPDFSSLLSKEALQGEGGIKNARKAFLKSLGRSRSPLNQLKKAFEEYCKGLGEYNEVLVPVPELVIAPEEVNEHPATPARSARRRARNNSEEALKAGTPARRVKREYM